LPGALENATDALALAVGLQHGIHHGVADNIVLVGIFIAELWLRPKDVAA